MKRAEPAKITAFFTPRPKCVKVDNATTEADVLEDTNCAEVSQDPHSSHGAEHSSVVVAAPQEPRLDIANFVGNKGTVKTDAEKVAIIHQKVPAIEALPLSYEGGQKRRFQPTWCSTYPWLKFSILKNGGYCVACVLFARDSAGTGGQTSLRTLVLEPMSKYKKALEYLANHNQNGYHVTAMTRMDAFLNTMRDQSKAIDAIISTKRQEQIERNRRLLIPVIESVLFCGRNMLPLRGHRDDGPLDLSVPSVNGEGVFRGLLRYRANGGDAELMKLLTSSNKNSTLISKTIQDEIIEISGRLVQEKVVSSVSGVFAIMMDETTDVSGKEQATICVRHFSGGQIREDFLCFVHAKDLTGEGLARLLLSTVKSVGLDMNSCRGLCFDGASAMMGKFRGCAAIVVREYPLAKMIHCFNHRLNLVLTKACDAKEVKLALQTLNEVYNFIYSSNMRSMRFAELVKSHTSTKKKKLVSLCATRWVERHDSVIVFIEFLPVIAIFLEDESNSEATAGLLLIAIREPGFLIGLVVAESVLAHTVEPSRALQSPTVDLVSAYATIGEVVTYLKKTRKDALSSFHDVFKKAEELLQEIGSSHDTVPVPRVCRRQTQRANVPFQTAEEYYRRSVYVPFLDQVLTELQSRFGDDTIPIGFNIKHLLSGADGDVAALLEAAKVYETDIEALSLVKAEAERWFSATVKFDSIGDALAHAQTRMYPNLAKLLQVLITLPVSNAEAERSFSTLKRLKTYLRNTMGQERLNGLALLGVHNEIDIKIDSIINVFAQKNRKLMFV